MTGKESFGVVVRTVGLLSGTLGLYWTANFVFVFIANLHLVQGPSVRTAGSFLLNLAILAFGLALLRWPHHIVRFTYDAATPPGSCSNCSYDLRATPDRCPECGTPASTTR